MTVLQLSDVVALCLRHTEDPVRVGRAVAVAWCESQFKTDARCYNVRDPRTGKVVCQKDGVPAGPILSVDRGLWQFNSQWHPEISDADCDDPGKSTTRAFSVSHGFLDFHEWVASKRTDAPFLRVRSMAEQEAREQIKREKDINPGRDAVAAVGGAMLGAGQTATAVVGGVASVVTSIPEFLGLLTKRETWMRVLYVIAGLAALGGGAVLLNRDLFSQLAGGVTGGTATAIAGAAGAVA